MGAIIVFTFGGYHFDSEEEEEEMRGRRRRGGEEKETGASESKTRSPIL